MHPDICPICGCDKSLTTSKDCPICGGENNMPPDICTNCGCDKSLTASKDCPICGEKDNSSAVRLCDICGKNQPENNVIKDIGTYGTENICKDCLQDYDPYEGIVRVYPRNNRRTKP